MRLATVEGLIMTAIGLIALKDGFSSLQRMSFVKDVLSPGMYLIAISAIFLACGAIYLAFSWKGEAAEAAISGKSLGTAVRVLLIYAGYVLLLPSLGYLFSTLVFFPVMFWAFGVKLSLRTGILSVVLVVCFYIVFIRLASIMMPMGFLEGLF